jgi:hypothetical protein
MAQHDHDSLSAPTPEVIDTVIDNGAVSEWQQRLKVAHALRTSGGEHDSSNVFHGRKITGKTGLNKVLIRRGVSASPG